MRMHWARYRSGLMFIRNPFSNRLYSLTRQTSNERSSSRQHRFRRLKLLEIISSSSGFAGSAIVDVSP
jgi:hypothetical protein